MIKNFFRATLLVCIILIKLLRTHLEKKKKKNIEILTHFGTEININWRNTIYCEHFTTLFN